MTTNKSTFSELENVISSYFGMPIGIPNDERLTIMIERACDPRLSEPDMGLNLEICDVVNKKKQNIPFAVSEYLVQLANNRDSKIAMLALILLDTCVRNCGYPFQLQIGRKEFLNEFVKRFPDQPPAFPTSVQLKILELIHEWKLGLASQVRFKHDFRKISELHNILSFKGYKFPTIKPERVNTIVSKPAFSSAEELEEADKEALSAKLQEHIRRGTPADLAKANEIMKLLTDYEEDKKPDYQSLVERQLANIERAIELLSEKLVVPGVAIDSLIQDLYNECNAAQSKIQKLILEEEENENATRLLDLNDKLNELNSQYECARKSIVVESAPIRFSGNNPDYVSQSQPLSETHPTSRGTSQAVVEPESSVSLIDLGDDFMSPNMGLDPLNTSLESSAHSSNLTIDLPPNLLDSLEGIHFGDGPTPSPSVISGPSTPHPIQLNSGSTSPTPPSRSNGINGSDLLGGPYLEASLFSENEPDTSLNKSTLVEDPNIKVITSSFCEDYICYLQFDFHNPSPYKIDHLDLKLAVPKDFTTVISGITSTYLLPRIGHVSLPVEIKFKPPKTRRDIKYRYIVTFTANNKPFTYQGETRDI